MARAPQLQALLDKLDVDQRIIAGWEPTRPHARIIAAAGSGKSTSAAALGGRLLADEILKPDELAVLTFSNKAGKSLKRAFERVLVPDHRAGLTLGTFHSVALKALNALGEVNEIGMPKWSIAYNTDAKGRDRAPTTPAGWVFWRCAVEYGNLPGTNKPSLRLKQQPDEYARAADLLRSYGIRGPEELGDAPDKLYPKLPEFAEAWGLVNDARKALGVWDFNDVLQTYLDGIIAGKIQARKRVVIVDESQDQSRVQLMTALALAGAHPDQPDFRVAAGRVLLIGDPRQAIYGFRGAFPELFLGFDQTYGAETLQIRTNYRSDAAIVDLGNKVVANKPWALGASAKAARAAHGGAIDLFVRPNDGDLFEAVADDVQAKIKRGAAPGSFAILCRTNAVLGEYQARLAARDIPCVIVGGTSIFDHREVETVLCYCILSQVDAFNSLEKVINYPKRFLGHAVAAALKQQRGMGVTSVLQAIVNVSRSSGSAPQQRNLMDLHATIARLRRLPWAEVPDAVDAMLQDALPKEGAKKATSSPDEDRPALYKVAARIAKKFDDPVALAEFAMKCSAPVIREDDDTDGTRVILSTVHACVCPETTLVETSEGVQRAGSVAAWGVIGTADGPRDYRNFVRYENRRMLRITTEDGYTIGVTTDHGMMAWTGEDYARVDGEHLQVGQFLRLALTPSVQPLMPARLPNAETINLDVRAQRYPLPQWLTPDGAFLLGALVADGTVFRQGVRYHKVYKSACDAVAAVWATWGVQAKVSYVADHNMWTTEVHSTHVVAWLRQIGGLDPRMKATPPCVYAASTGLQCAYLRGLFSDGTVSVRRGVLDVVSLTTSVESVARDAQFMLRRLGMISRVFRVKKDGMWRVEMYSTDAKKFMWDVGFPDQERTEKGRRAPVGHDRSVVPVSYAEAQVTSVLCTRRNARARGYVSRRIIARDLPHLVDRLRFHHVRIAKIEAYKGPAVCVTVPDGGRFLQNGFDGFNSKGKEFAHVFLHASMGAYPYQRRARGAVFAAPKGDVEEERRLLYVGVTRAMDRLTIAFDAQSGPCLLLEEVMRAECDVAVTMCDTRTRA